jgi:hypothetical protein
MTVSATRLPCALPLALVGMLLATPALAQTTTSIRTPLEKCRTVEDDGEVGDYTLERCPGLAGAAVYMEWSASHTTLSFRWRKAKSGDVVTGYGLGDRLEWRGRKGRHGFTPDAIIVRVKVRDDNSVGNGPEDKTYNVLAVIRMEKRKACLMAAIDETANLDAPALARTAADTEAVKFVCGKGKVRIIGKPSQWAQRLVGEEAPPK